MSVVDCADGSGVLPLARAHQPEVILLDAGLPGLDASTCVDELERLVETRSCVVVLTCPHDMAESRVAELESGGGLLVLVKPLTREGMLHAVAQAFAESRSRATGSRPRGRRAA